MEKASRARGFTLIEALVVITVIMLIAAMTMPSVTRFLQTYRLIGGASDLANILQRARYEAIRLNRSNPPLFCRAQLQGNRQAIWIDVINNSIPDPTESIIVLPQGVQFLGSGQVPSLASMGPAYANAQQPPGFIAFDGRGTVSGPPVVYVTFLGFPGDPTYGFRAITLTPTGRTKIWSAVPGGAWHSP